MERQLQNRADDEVLDRFHPSAEGATHLHTDPANITRRRLGRPKPRHFQIQNTCSLRQLPRDVVTRRAIVAKPIVPEIDNRR
jgi:hypothetical protein